MTTDAEALAYFGRITLYIDADSRWGGAVHVRAGCAHQTRDRWPINYHGSGATVLTAIASAMMRVRQGATAGDLTNGRWAIK